MATDVVKQAGGISAGGDASGARATFAAGLQFRITDPAFTAGGEPKVGGGGGGAARDEDPMRAAGLMS